MPTQRLDLIQCCEGLLQPGLFKDYCPNGLQVQGCNEVEHIVTGVTACRALIEAAIDLKAHAILTHHGYFWKGQDETLTGTMYERVKLLIKHEINLLVYHLPLDAHPDVGNNRYLADALGIRILGPLQSSDQPTIGYWGELMEPLSGEVLAQRMERALDRQPTFVSGHDRPVHQLAWCSGGAQDDIHHAIRLGLDAYISGEASERTFHLAKEHGIHYYAAGHHATERGGIQRLGDFCAKQLGIRHTFVDIPNPF